MGAVLVVLGVGMLVIDQQPWFPFLFFLLLAVALLACFELLQLLPKSRRPRTWLCYLSVGGLIAANWIPHLLPSAGNPWYWITAAFTVVVLSAFLIEMVVFQTPGESTTRIALAVLIAAYLGLLPSFSRSNALAERTGTGTSSNCPGYFCAQVLRYGRLLCRSTIRAAASDTCAKPEEDLGRTTRWVSGSECSGRGNQLAGAGTEKRSVGRAIRLDSWCRGGIRRSR